MMASNHTSNMQARLIMHRVPHCTVDCPVCGCPLTSLFPRSADWTVYGTFLRALSWSGSGQSVFSGYGRPARPTRLAKRSSARSPSRVQTDQMGSWRS